MKIFDKDNDGYLKYSEFCDAFLPLDTAHASQLAAKPPTVSLSNQNGPTFNELTKNDYKNVWKTHIMICQSID